MWMKEHMMLNDALSHGLPEPKRLKACAPLLRNFLDPKALKHPNQTLSLANSIFGFLHGYNAYGSHSIEPACPKVSGTKSTINDSGRSLDCAHLQRQRLSRVHWESLENWPDTFPGGTDTVYKSEVYRTSVLHIKTLSQTVRPSPSNFVLAEI